MRIHGEFGISEEQTPGVFPYEKGPIVWGNFHPGFFFPSTSGQHIQRCAMSPESDFVVASEPKSSWLSDMLISDLERKKTYGDFL